MYATLIGVGLLISHFLLLSIVVYIYRRLKEEDARAERMFAPASSAAHPGKGQV